MAGIVYVMTNEGMDGLVKIGMTKNLPKRVDALSRHAGVPLRFVVRCAIEVEDADKVETLLHESYASCRINSGREFFRVPFEDVVGAMKLATVSGGKLVKDDHVVESGESEIPESVEDTQGSVSVHGLLPKRGMSVDFQSLKIPEGEILLCVRDSSEMATVMEHGKIEYKGSQMSISKAARKAMNVDYPVNGMEFWEYKGEILSARRRRLKAEHEASKSDNEDLE